MPVPGWLGGVFAGAAAGALGAMGLGGGGVLLLWLAFSGMDQLAAQGVNLFFILPVGAAGLWLHRKNGLVAWRAALPMGVGGLAGLGAGVALAGRLPGTALSKLLGLLLAVVAVREGWGAVTLFRRNGAGLWRSSSGGGAE